MPISRDPRMDRRRRVLRDSVADEQAPVTRTRRGQAEEPQESSVRRGAGYSQDVRGACGHRLVQLIPIRIRSYTAVIFASLLIPSLLLTAHYMIYVNGHLPWWGHPMAIALDASHPQGIAAWFCSHLWLLCLAATLLTFQLRKHKLDDYNGEYRLWFWLVVTCLIASIDSTTHITELFGLSLDHWSQLNLGWSGPAVVEGTLAVLIGMLGLRLCTELKSVPSSLMFWLGGLVAWAGSAALGQEELKVELTIQFRIWLKCALWLGGLTAIWLAALSFLRSTYIEAQRRFLLRGPLAIGVGVPLGRRIRESMPRMPAMPSFRRQRASDEIDEDVPVEGTRRWGIPSFRRTKSTEPEDLSSTKAEVRSRTPAKAAGSPSQPEKTDAVDDAPSVKRGLGGFLKRGGSKADDSRGENEQKRSVTGGWLRKAKDSGEAEEFRKIRAEERAEAAEQARLKREQRKAEKRNRRAQGDDEGAEQAPKRSWVPKLGRPTLPSMRMPKMKSPKNWLPKLKVPAFSLNFLKLRPPEAGDEEDGQASDMQPVQGRRSLPSTSNSDTSDNADDSAMPSGRPLTKAERKRQRRLQQQNRAA